MKKHSQVVSALLAVVFGVALLVPSLSTAQALPYLMQWGSYGSGDGQFYLPHRVAVGGSGNVYVADTYNHRIQKFTSNGTFLLQWGSFGYGNGQFNDPIGIAVDNDGFVYVSERYGSRVQKFTSDGDYVLQWGSRGNGDGQFAQAIDIEVNDSGIVYVSENVNERVQYFTSDGVFLGKWGTAGSGDGQFMNPWGLAVDSNGNVYVADTVNHRIQKFTPDGVFLRKYGGVESNQDGSFNRPEDVALDSSGRIYVADTYNARIQVFDNDGNFLTKWGEYGAGDGQLMNPVGIFVDDGGLVYVADTDNHRIQVFGPNFVQEVAFDFTPNTINLASNGLWVTGFIEPASPFAAGDIDILSIRLNGTVPVAPGAPTNVGDHNSNGVPDLMVKFSRSAVELAVTQGERVAVTVTGIVGGCSFSGTDYIRARRAVVTAPLAGGCLTAGAVTQVRWQTPSSVKVESVALLQSLDGGGNWSLIARDQPGSGSYDWTVPSTSTDRAKVAVVLIESAEETGYLVDGVLGVSDAFSIMAMTGVRDIPAGGKTVLGQNHPNPFNPRTEIEFSLPQPGRATLAIYDVRGTRIVTLVDTYTLAGMHRAEWDGLDSRGGATPSGIYLARLETEDGVQTIKVTLAR